MESDLESEGRDSNTQGGKSQSHGLKKCNKIKRNIYDICALTLHVFPAQLGFIFNTHLEKHPHTKHLENQN